jgi:hypothetical protein
LKKNNKKKSIPIKDIYKKEKKKMKERKEGRKEGNYTNNMKIIKQKKRKMTLSGSLKNIASRKIR